MCDVVSEYFPLDFSFSFWYYPKDRKYAEQMTLDSSEYDLVIHPNRLWFVEHGHTSVYFVGYEVDLTKNIVMRYKHTPTCISYVVGRLSDEGNNDC